MIKLLLATISSLVLAAGLFHACGVERPAATENRVPLVLHAGRTETSCVECHEPGRPSPSHGKGKDCVGCHSAVDDVAGSWIPAHPYTHDPAPDACLRCHVRERPAPPHPEAGDCASCHKFPSWQK